MTLFEKEGDREAFEQILEAAVGRTETRLLHLLELDHERLTYRHNGRDFRLTEVQERVVHEILS